MKRQRGGFAIGLIVGLLIGLGLALGVALYVTKVPIPFIDKVPQRTADQDAAEAERNKAWDPNAPLAGKPQAPRPAASGVATPPPAAPGPAVTASAPAAPAARTASAPDPAAILSGGSPKAAAAASAARSTAAGVEPFVYYLQVGAYSRPEDAEQQRARLAMLGHAAKVTEREQSGRTVYRVRLGPYEKREEADAGKERLMNDAFEAALVRVDR